MPKKEKRGTDVTSHNKCIKPLKESQEHKVLVHMQRYGSITSMEAFHKYNITRLSAKIFNLRKDGYDIGMQWETSPNGARYGRYVLREEDVA